jgi:hypothetical protein
MRHLAQALFVAAVVLFPTFVHAQELAGVVRDASGAVLPGVNVEAASPALIEKVRATVTDGTGQYRITDLRPGLYEVTFTLPGFTVVKRTGVQVSGAQVFTINADMRVGGVQETITVTGETPVVDVQTSTKRQTVLDDAVIQSMPASRGYGNLLAAVPAIQTTGANNVGGNPNMSFFTAMGGRSNEGTVQINGMNVGSAFNGGGVAGFGYDMVTAAEVQITVTGGLADVDRGGPAFNIIPRAGGNSFAGMAFASYAGEWSQGDNLDDELRSFGIVNLPALVKSWDTNFALGGPIKRDRLWFFSNVRSFGNYTTRAGLGWNVNAGNAAVWDYKTDLTKSVRDANSKNTGAIRLTGQLTPRNKLEMYYDYQKQCTGSAYSADGEQCRARGDDWTGLGSLGGFGSASPESGNVWDDREKIVQANWSSPATNRLLLEAGLSSFNSRWGGQQPAGALTNLIPVTELSTAINPRTGEPFVPLSGMTYHGYAPTTTNDQQHNVWRASGTYVTGSHSIKVGYQAAYQVIHFEQTSGDDRLTYTFFGGNPISLQQRMTPFLQSNRTVYHAFYAQDQWSIKRLTVQAGLRYERAFSFGPGNGENAVLPNRFNLAGVSFPRTVGVKGQNDISPRFGLAYDVFGTGKTSLKMNLSHYLQSASNDGIYTSSNPAFSYQYNTTRTWLDNNGNKVPDCDLNNLGLQIGGDLCGAVANANFGNVFSPTTVDPALLSGWGTRPYDWQIGVGVQQQILPRVSVEVAYNRRAWGNFLVTDNLALGPQDFERATITTPTNAKLPDGGGQPATFLVQTPTNFGLANNYQTFSDNYGSRTDYWHGVDFNVTARMASGLIFQGGTNTGRGVRDMCEVIEKLPEIQALPPFGAAVQRVDSCAVTEKWLTTARGVVTYTIPKVDVLVSGVFRSNPNTVPANDPASTGGSLAANYTATNAEIIAALGRPLPGNATTKNVNLLLPNQLYGPRLNSMDARFAKILRFGGTRTTVGIDFYNLFNANDGTIFNQGFSTLDGGAAYLRPTAILNPRFARFNVTLDF